MLPVRRHFYQGRAGAPEYPGKRPSAMIPYVNGELSHLLFENALILAVNRFK
jgi:hypothetical protein